MQVAHVLERMRRQSARGSAYCPVRRTHKRTLMDSTRADFADRIYDPPTSILFALANSVPIIQAIIQPAKGEKSPPRVRGGLDRSAKQGWLLQLGTGDLAAGVHLPDLDIERATRSFAPIAYISE